MKEAQELSEPTEQYHAQPLEVGGNLLDSFKLYIYIYIYIYIYKHVPITRVFFLCLGVIEHSFILNAKNTCCTSRANSSTH